VEPVGWAEIKLWDTVTGQERATLKGGASVITSLAFSPDGTTLAAGGTIFVGKEARGSEVKMWDVATGRERATLKGHACVVTSLAFSPDGTTLAVGTTTWDGPNEVPRSEVKLWVVVTGQKTRTLSSSPDRSVLSMAFSPDGRTLAAGNGVPNSREYGGELKLWDVATGQVRAELRTTAGHIRCAAFSPDGRLLAAACKDGTAKLWNVSHLIATARDAVRPPE
jgi:WD40 repeat protein